MIFLREADYYYLYSEFTMKNLTVDVIAPASRCPISDVEKIQSFLASWHLKYHISDDLFGSHPFCSNTDEKRFNQLKYALTNTNSQIIWCVRGGYGSMKLIPLLNQIEPPKEQKIFIGSSDITALHIFLQQQWGWTTIHAPSLYSAALQQVSAESLEILKNLIFQKQNPIVYQAIHGLNKSALADITLSAPIIGGNLTLIQSSLSTSWQIDASGKILFIEEVNERGYRIDRALEQLKQANIFKSAEAILFGDFLGGEEPDGKSLVQDALSAFADTSEIPVLQIQGIGHGFINNPLILGKKVELHTGSDASLAF